MRLNNDKWDDLGVVYKVLSYFKDVTSTSVKLELQTIDGAIHTRVEPEAYIEWLQDGDTNVSF